MTLQVFPSSLDQIDSSLQRLNHKLGTSLKKKKKHHTHADATRECVRGEEEEVSLTYTECMSVRSPERESEMFGRKFTWFSPRSAASAADACCSSEQTSWWWTGWSNTPWAAPTSRKATPASSHPAADKSGEGGRHVVQEVLPNTVGVSGTSAWIRFLTRDTLVK